MADEVYRETINSHYPKTTYDEALEQLNDIRECHPKQEGWQEIRGFVEKRSDGYYAVREHIRIRRI